MHVCHMVNSWYVYSWYVSKNSEIGYIYTIVSDRNLTFEFCNTTLLMQLYIAKCHALTVKPRPSSDYNFALDSA